MLHLCLYCFTVAWLIIDVRPTSSFSTFRDEEEPFHIKVYTPLKGISWASSGSSDVTTIKCVQVTAAVMMRLGEERLFTFDSYNSRHSHMSNPSNPLGIPVFSHPPVWCVCDNVQSAVSPFRLCRQICGICCRLWWRIRAVHRLNRCHTMQLRRTVSKDSGAFVAHNYARKHVLIWTHIYQLWPHSFSYISV